MRKLNSTQTTLIIHKKNKMSEIITAINAKPETIKTFLGNYLYVIPDYQRPYSWRKDECVKLWEDFINYFEEEYNPESPYFLGNVVIYNQDKKRWVVDGQQRLITLNLLIRALLEKCKTFTVLEKIIYQLNPLTGEVETPYKVRVEHNVLGDNENRKLEDAILNQQIESKYTENYDVFLGFIEAYLRGFDGKQIEKFVLTLIDNVVLLPIECTDFESALTIFETINNRGMDLSDADIFKSKLYKYSLNQNNFFVERWNDLSSNVDKTDIEIKDLFTHLMHVLRGKEGNVESIIGLRKFYDQDNSKRLKDWEEVMTSLEKLLFGWNYISEEKYGASAIILNWIKVLKKYPNSYWEYPIMTFLHNNVYYKKNEYRIDNEDKLLDLIKETTKYCYWKWLKFRGVNAIKDTIFKVVRAVYNNGDYKQIYKEDISNESNSDKRGKESSLNNILDNDLGRGLKGLCLMVSLLNEKQNSIIPDDWQIEHILPKKWGHYKYEHWNEQCFNQYHGKLGNLVTLEKKLNPKASNRFFQEKRIIYGSSDIAEVRDIANYLEWSPENFKERNKKVKKIITEFLIE